MNDTEDGGAVEAAADMRLLSLVLLGCFALASCSEGGATVVFYVVVEPGETEKFIGAVTAVAKEDGLETTRGEAVTYSGGALKIVEGRGHGLKLWVQNAMLSGHENPELCGVYPEPHPDPAQFMVFTEPRFLGSKAAARELGELVLSRLRKAGFSVRRDPPVCGAAAIHEGSAPTHGTSSNQTH